MADLAPGVTRYPLPRRHYQAVGVGGVVCGVLLLLLQLAVAVWLFDSDPVTVLVILAACVLVPPATILLPWLLRLVISVAAGIAALAWANGRGHFGGGYALSWLVGSAVGLGALMGLVYLRWRRERLSRAEGAAPSGLDPSNGKDVGLFATWRDGQYEYEAAQPSLEVVLDAVRALDGVHRSFVSIFNGRGRMDVGGDAHGRLVVLQSDNRNYWHMVEDPHASEGREPVVIGGVRTQYPRRRTTTLAAAEHAVTTWLRHAERDPSLDWWTEKGLDSAFRPRTIAVND